MAARKEAATAPFRSVSIHAKTAQRAYETLLVDCREGTPLNQESFYVMDAIVAEGLKKGQHLYTMTRIGGDIFESH